MDEEKSRSFVSPRGIKYIIIYLTVFVLPFLLVQNQPGMTSTTFKTLGFITLPISLIIWIYSLEMFHNLFWIHITINIILDILILLCIGSLIERRNN